MAYQMTDSEKEMVVKKAIESVASILKVRKLPLFDKNISDALIDAYVQGCANTIEYLQGKYDKPKENQ